MAVRCALAVASLAACVAGCGDAQPTPPPGGRLRVVAAENVWGSLAAQLGGNRVQVTSIIAGPNADPHDYEPRPADARALASAQLAIVNGAGYDEWANKLIGANPVAGRLVLNVGERAGVGRGGNPHQWYSPATVARVIGALVDQYKRLDPHHAAYFDRLRASVQTRSLGRYRALIARIRQRYGGTPVGASESVFAPLATALGLRLVTPPAFLAAVSEGADPAVADKRTADRQIARGEIAVWVYNRQNATPDVERLNAAAQRSGIPIATVTETLPADTSFVAWQTGQLAQLERALAQGVRR